MDEQLQPEQAPPPKSTRSFEEWRKLLVRLVKTKLSRDIEVDEQFNERVRPYYDKAFMPEVAFNDLFNK